MATITHVADDSDTGMTANELYEFLVALTDAGIHYPGRLVAVTGPDGQLLSLTHGADYDPRRSPRRDTRREN